MKTIRITFLFLLLSLSAGAQSFTKIVTGSIVNTPRDSRSVNWVDIDNDGLIDLFISNGHGAGDNNLLYHNDGNGSFTAVTNDPIVSDSLPSVGATWADMDNDGDIDCYVVNWYNKKNLLYDNNGDGSFTLLNSGLISTELSYSETAAWGDYDNDGLVDLYVTNSAGNLRNFLYHNEGNHAFTKIVQQDPAVTDTYASRGTNWTDYDLDGDMDLFVCNENNTFENLYENDSLGNFTSIPMDEMGVNEGNTMSSNFMDYDNDGDLDFFLVNYQGNNSLFRNNSDGSYSVMAGDTICTTPAYAFGSNWGDIDNDGDLDVYITNAFVTGQQLHNYLYTNNGDGTFSRDAGSVLVADSGWSYGCAFGDYDNDGFLDLAVANCYGGAQSNSLFHNDGNANHWIEIHCVGVVSNRSAIGAKVYVKATINGVETWQVREISSQSGYCGQNMLTAHFGLGDAVTCSEVRIEWPSGIVDQYTAVAADERAYAYEGQILELPVFEDPANTLTNFPNPFHGETTIVCKCASSEKVTLTIHDADGRAVRQLFSGKLEAGEHSFLWDGTDNRRQPVGQGTYTCVLRSGKTEILRRIVYVSGE